MAAISTAMLAMTRPGDVILYTAPAYGGTEYLFDRILPRYGIKAVSVPAASGGAELDAAIARTALEAKQAGGRLAVVYVETPANPTNQLVDVARAAAAVRAVDQAEPPVLAVDNTFLGPLWQSPLALGADLVLYSLTKYVGGHSDLISGSCLGGAALMARVAEMRTICGTTTDPHTAWLLSRSLETLHIRMERAQENAIVLAERLRAHPRVQAVLTAGGPDASPEQQTVFAEQCKGAGSTFAVELHGGEPEAFRVLNALRLFKLAVSLGGAESLASHPSSMTHSDYSPEAKTRCGIGENLIRLSVGIENVEDLWADLRQALDAA